MKYTRKRKHAMLRYIDAVVNKHKHVTDVQDLFTQLIKDNRKNKSILTARRYSVLLHRAAEWIISAWQHLAIHCPIHLRPIASCFFRINTPTGSTLGTPHHNHCLRQNPSNSDPHGACITHLQLHKYC